MNIESLKARLSVEKIKVSEEILNKCAVDDVSNLSDEEKDLQAGFKEVLNATSMSGSGSAAYRVQKILKKLEKSE